RRAQEGKNPETYRRQSEIARVCHPGVQTERGIRVAENFCVLRVEPVAITVPPEARFVNNAGCNCADQADRNELRTDGRHGVGARQVVSPGEPQRETLRAV